MKSMVFIAIVTVLLLSCNSQILDETESTEGLDVDSLEYATKNAGNAALTSATNKTRSELEGLWLNSNNTGYSFRGNGFCLIYRGKSENTFRGTFSIADGKITFVAVRWSWTQPYNIDGEVLFLEYMPNANYGYFSKQ